MKKRILGLFCAAALLLSGCGTSQRDTFENARLRLVATTYPVYLFASAVTQGVDGVVVERLNTGETSCLHDYTLSVSDMKKLDGADVVLLNGAGLESFMEDALDASDAATVDCSLGAELLENPSHHHEQGDHEHDGHDHGHFDSHIWMDPANAAIMAENLANALAQLDGEYAALYRENLLAVIDQLSAWDKAAWDMLTEQGSMEITGLITFHDGFRYFAHAYDLPLLESIEEEAGSEASAREIVEITHLVQEYELPVIFTETNGSEATAKAIARETGCAVVQLSMCMDGPDASLSRYGDALLGNISAIVKGFADGEGGETE